MAGSKGSDKLGGRDRFIEMARELGSDEDEAAFKEKLAAIARHKPKGHAKRTDEHDADE